MATSSTYKRTHAGIGHVGSYQVSGYPWISGSIATKAGSATAGATSEFKFEFPRVTKTVEVIFVSGTAGLPDVGTGTAGLRIHFNSTGSKAVAPVDGVTQPDATDGTALVNNGGTSTVIQTNHYVELNAKDESVSFDVKCKEIYISRAKCSADTQSSNQTNIEFRVVAILTNIPAGELSDMSGSGLTE
jgi:hypothetical protein